MLTSNFSPLTSKWLSRSLLAAILSTMSCFTGLTPSISLKSAAILDFNSAALAQQSAPSLSAAEITNYARSLLAIEPLRQEYYNQIKQRFTGREEMPQIICSDQDSVNRLPREIRESAIDYCQKSIAIVENNSLTIQRFNQITNLLTQDTRILERITAELLRLQTPNLFQ
ncbi:MULTISPECIES: DUF4168 domain-containing protein [Planktothricoides]|uniref:DUF4168 domain-containing protein n=2 Tax=Planktothricoides raciborskii TaxID=132608 RepID=A0AAU8JAC4_9CYAN|nr:MULTISPECIES: DUF4168 domain-containing protein [Planktothricoides]KOR38516.1 hypothetical protein AM228_00570 [Planktothricoides sp. SR001]MBD2545422.1 DUF4168 domain-containing protein [Planktothricoides raciborskii FACHB-1370]MBD2583650.1 DUF4168 domain-containing protein [Planktothricoides raciborskii FACHB-1261]